MSFLYQKRDLPNGIRLRAVNLPQSPTVTFAVLVGAGSRNESEETSGIAHFIEHNVFKGTPGLPNSQVVSDAIESLGGIHNAFTSHEYTGFWAKAQSSKLKDIAKVISDIFLNPLFPERDLEIERGNVIEELNMYEDDPRSKTRDAFICSVFKGHSLGQPVVGYRENLKRFQREDLVSFRQDFYDPARLVVIAAGNIDSAAFFDQVAGLFNSYNLGKNYHDETYQVTQQKPQVIVINREANQQANLMLGFRSLPEEDSRKEVLDLAVEILGGSASLSSRLFQRIRDQLGLAYYVYSADYGFRETGVWFTAAGVSVDNHQKAVTAILDEYHKLTQEPVSVSELARAKEHLKGQLAFSLETSDGVMEFFGGEELTRKVLKTPDEVMSKIDAVTAGDIQKLCQDLVIKELLTVTLLGPFDENKERNEILKLL